ncbi:YeiH family protein [Arenicella xantha]|uniref:Putative integral membrane protein (TIGR00698 family) n=1 Tax=Arenicella xantha TaxID=644221 RepID=A0A395JFR8_9GAMM|nr:putative sulfate exporter family transporter [Arenicella xantha]RBP48579.1 putative integral membrane protein (TIGR00698 family) [Arenicella xantha]
MKDTIDRLAPGVGVSVICGLAALFLSEHYATPVMLLALLLGIAVSFLYDETRCRAGIDFVASHVLRIGVALIGLRIAWSDLTSLGWQTLAVLAVGVLSTITFGYVLARATGMSRHFGILTGGAVGICGASAALAISSVLPPSPSRERDTLLTVIGVTLLSTVAMVVYPMIAGALDLSTQDTSLFLGGTIHDVAQVVGAGYSVSNETGDLATLTKLVRVSFLIPVVMILVVVLHSRRTETPHNRPTILPWFLIAFVGLMLLNSLVTLPEPVLTQTSNASRFALVIAIAAIGMKSNLRQLLEVGMKPILILVAETTWIALLFLIYICCF